ncbi:lipase 1-like [Hyposmocoma kahamanoa]|uniref:lipase 1-like n=1 Tax=Hyposmocoma kahamanoa TaxID=1477025 RepID=UPI000E6D7398|nr:lipase 1-like [Hyposmocoma kahamanoa]
MNYAYSLTRPNRLLTISLPDKRPLKKALGFIEDTYLNFTELTTKYKYPTEEHTVTTDDGYILRVFRILPKCNGTSKALPVVTMHGIYDSSDEYILPGPKTGLGYILSRNCYDVWAANHRGNVYSRRHVHLNPDTDPEFWEYTFDEHGYFDIPAIVDYVLEATQQTKLNYIGHSQGTTDFLVMTSLRPEYNDKIQISFQIAPVAYLRHIRSFIPKLLAQAHAPLGTILKHLGLRELLGRQQIVHFVIEFLCQFAPEDICGAGFALTTGYKRGYIKPRNLAVVFGHLISGISTKDLIHFSQLITSGRFQRFDNGMAGNLKKYSSVIPPEYNVSKITSAVVLICARNDYVSELEDIAILRSKLQNVVEYYVAPDPYWSHNDHFYAIKAPQLVFSKILEHLNKVNV